MRVAFVATSYPRSRGDAAGHFVRAEARAAVRAGHEVHVVAPGVHADEGIVGHEVRGRGLFGWPGAVARVAEHPHRLLALPGFWHDVRCRLDAIAADHVVAHWLVPSAYPVVRADEIVCHGADVRALLAAPRVVRERIVVLTARRAKRIRFVATALRDALLEGCGGEAAELLLARAEVRPPVIDVDEREEVPQAERPARYVVAAGRFVQDKRFGWAIDAAAGAGLPLVLLGDGPLRACLQRRARERGAEVVFPGRLKRPRALGWIAEASALVHPSAVESAPTVILEARALGVPVVATAAGDVMRWAARDRGLHVGCAPDDLARLLALVLHAKP